MDHPSPTVTKRSGAAQRLLVLLVAVLATLTATVSAASASPAFTPASTSRITVVPAAETRVGVATAPALAHVGPNWSVVAGQVRQRYPRFDSTAVGSCVATNTPRAGASSVVDDVMAETRAGSGNLTSKYTLTADEALTAGERWVGPGYTEIGKPGSGVFRSADGTRQFRIDNGSITGAHKPGVPHVHLETISPGSKVPVANNHIPFKN